MVSSSQIHTCGLAGPLLSAPGLIATVLTTATRMERIPLACISWASVHQLVDPRELNSTCQLKIFDNWGGKRFVKRVARSRRLHGRGSDEAACGHQAPGASLRTWLLDPLCGHILHGASMGGVGGDFSPTWAGSLKNPKRILFRCRLRGKSGCNHVPCLVRRRTARALPLATCAGKGS